MRQEFKLVNEVGLYRVKRIGSGGIPEALQGGYTDKSLAIRAVNDFVDGFVAKREASAKRKADAVVNQANHRRKNRDAQRARRAEEKKNAEKQTGS